MGQMLCGLCAICGMMIITVPIPMLVSSFAITYKSKLWRSKISTKRRLLQGKATKKTNILLNLASSSGMSGVLLCASSFPSTFPLLRFTTRMK